MIIGISGSGKSTLLHIISSIIKPTTGRVLIDDAPIKRKDVSLILQQPFFFGNLSLKENLSISASFIKGYNLKEEKLLFIETEILNIQDRKISLCSGGEKARANIVRGLLSNKNVILIDEPTAHLDENMSYLIAKVLRKKATDAIVIVTTHQPQFFKFSNSIFLYLRDKKLIGNEKFY